MQQTEKYWNLINRIVLVAIGIMASIGVVLAFTPKVQQLQEFQTRLDKLQHRIDQTEAEERKLKESIQRFRSDPEFVKRVAHEVGYASPGERVFHFPEEADDDSDDF